MNKQIPKEKFKLVNMNLEQPEKKFETKPIGFFQDALIRFTKNKSSIVAFIGILLIVIMTIVGPYMTPYGYTQQNPDHANLPAKIPVLANIGILDGTRWLSNKPLDAIEDMPNDCVLEVGDEVTVIRGVEMVDVKVDYYKYVGIDDDTAYWFGTDYLGRDLWTRLWMGTRISLLIGVLSALANCFIGIIYGSISGYYGGKVDMVMMRVTEIVNAIPQIVLVTLFILYFGSGLITIVCALLLQNWIGTARLVRSQFYRFKETDYVLAARTLGVKDRTLIVRHIMPNAIGPVITRVMTAIPSAIFTEAFLAFLGLGIKPPSTSLGMLLADGQDVLMSYPTQVLFPAIVISILMVCFNLMSNGLRDAFDPTQRGV